MAAEVPTVSEMNRHGLSRHIPAAVKREVRQRSKFGCVVCRRGFYQYEHVDPAFEDATGHDPNRICCLCGACHDSVTRGHLSKDLVKAEYLRIQAQRPEEAAPPVGPLDFHDGTAELVIGGLSYNPAVRTVLRYHGQDVIRVDPGEQGRPGSISAVFTNDDGSEILRLDENEWIGDLSNWDIDVVGRRIKIRKKQGEVSLQVRLDPPGRVVGEYIDMRVGSGHVLATEQTYAVGRHLMDGMVHWAHVGLNIRRSTPLGVAIEFTEVEALEARDARLGVTGVGLATPDRQVVMNSNAGVMVKPLGIVVASLCGGFDMWEMAIGSRPLDETRTIIRSRPERLCQFIATGEVDG